VKVFLDGMPAWKKGKNLVISEAGALKNMMKEGDAFVLIDLRDPEAAAKGHIREAVSIPMKELAGAEGRFPKAKSAPIVLYPDGQAGVEAFNLVRGWGYKNASVLKGGLKGWKSARGKLTTGRPSTEVVYVKKLKPGEISAEEFSAVVKNRPKDKLILDVREGSSEGTLPGAVLIPQSELDARVGELPKDREIIIHCNTGILADMAQKTLEKHGYNVRTLNAVIQVAPDGSFEITE
jgi:rhodanese-related sulfurtransferase